MRFSLQIVKCFNNSRVSVELKKPINYVLVMLANQKSYRKTDWWNGWVGGEREGGILVHKKNLEMVFSNFPS